MEEFGLRSIRDFFVGAMQTGTAAAEDVSDAAVEDVSGAVGVGGAGGASCDAYAAGAEGDYKPLRIISESRSSAPSKSAPKEVRPSGDELLKMANAQVGERWYGIYMLGKKIGWQQDVWKKEGDLFCNETVIYLEMVFNGATSRVEIREKSWFSSKAPFNMVRYESVKDEDGKKVIIAGKVKGDKLFLGIDTGTNKRTIEVPSDSGLLSDALPWAAILRMKPGDYTKSNNFDEMTGERKWQKITLVSTEVRSVGGRDQPVFKVLVEGEDGIKLESMLTSDGTVIDGAVGENLKIVLEDETTAQDLSGGSLDFSSNSAIPATGEIDYDATARVKRMKIRLSGNQPIKIPETERQKVVERGDNYVVLEVVARPSAKANSGQPTKDSTKCNADVPCDSPDLIKQAEEIIRGAKNDFEKMRLLSSWVHKNFKYQLGTGSGPADQILNDKKGDCSEFSKALLLLARAAGVPVRSLSGVALASGNPPSFAYHAWVEAWVNGRWVAFDPTWDTYPVDATHIAFGIDDDLAMFSLFGSLSIDIIEVDYGDKKIQ